MSLTARALVPLADVKTYLSIGDTTYDTILEQLINSVSDEINSFTNRNLAETTYTDLYLDGNGKQILFLPNYPITAMTSVYEDGELLVEGEDDDYLVYQDEGYLWRVNRTWYLGPKKIKVTYTAGYVCLTGTITLPHDLKLATMMKIAREWKKQKSQLWGEDSRSFPDGSVSTSHLDDEFLEAELRILEKYKRRKI